MYDFKRDDDAAEQDLVARTNERQTRRVTVLMASDQVDNPAAQRSLYPVIEDC